MRVLILAAALAVAGTTPAIADNDSGLYVGVGAGRFNVEIDDIDVSNGIDESFGSDDTVYKLFAGWRFNPYLGVELAYMDLGGPEDTIENISVETEIAGVAPYLIGTVPLGPLEFFGKVGYYFYDVEISAEDTSVDDSGEDLVYGAGLGLTIFGRVLARLEYEIIDVSDVDDANAVWVSGAFRF